MIHLSLLFLDGHFETTPECDFTVRSHPHDLAVLSRPKSAGHAPLRTCIAKFAHLAKSDANTETSMSPLECSSAPGSLLWTADTRGRVAAQQASGSCPWRSVDDPSETGLASRTHSQDAENLQFSAGWTQKTHGS